MQQQQKKLTAVETKQKKTLFKTFIFDLDSKLVGHLLVSPQLCRTWANIREISFSNPRRLLKILLLSFFSHLDDNDETKKTDRKTFWVSKLSKSRISKTDCNLYLAGLFFSISSLFRRAVISEQHQRWLFLLSIFSITKAVANFDHKIFLTHLSLIFFLLPLSLSYSF